MTTTFIAGSKVDFLVNGVTQHGEVVAVRDNGYYEVTTDKSRYMLPLHEMFAVLPVHE